MACILAVRSVLVQLGFFLHIRVATLGGAAVLPPQLLFLTAFMAVFSIVIALFKDLPDVEGDAAADIRTAPVRLGVPAVFRMCLILLTVAYVAAIAVGATGSGPAWTRWAAGLTHGGLLAALWARAQQADTRSPRSLHRYYMFIWKLFYAEYALLPLFR